MTIRIGGIIHGIADCEDCNWHCENHNLILSESNKHARNYRHNVKVEVGYSYDYNGRVGP